MFIELPPVGKTVAAGDAIAVIESVKAASDIYAPVSGEIVGANDALTGTPDQINGTPYESWLFKIKPAADAKTDRSDRCRCIRQRRSASKTFQRPCGVLAQ